MRATTFLRTLATTAAMTIAMVGAAHASAQTVVLNSTVIETSSAGTWIVAATGRASYCQAVLSSNGAPMSRCNPIGSLAYNAAGYVFSTAGANLFAVNKTTGAIFSCTFVLMGGITPSGGCTQVSALSALQ